MTSLYSFILWQPATSASSTSSTSSGASLGHTAGIIPSPEFQEWRASHTLAGGKSPVSGGIGGKPTPTHKHNNGINALLNFDPTTGNSNGDDKISCSLFGKKKKMDKREKYTAKHSSVFEAGELNTYEEVVRLPCEKPTKSQPASKFVRFLFTNDQILFGPCSISAEDARPVRCSRRRTETHQE